MKNEVYKPVAVGHGINQAKNFHEAVRKAEDRLQYALSRATNVALGAHHKGLPSPVQNNDPEWAGEEAVSETLRQQCELVQELLYSCLQIMALYNDDEQKKQIADNVIGGITRQLKHWRAWDKPETLLFCKRLQEALDK